MYLFICFPEGSEEDKSETVEEKQDTEESEKPSKETETEEKKDEGTEKTTGRESPICLALEEEDSINEAVNTSEYYFVELKSFNISIAIVNIFVSFSDFDLIKCLKSK